MLKRIALIIAFALIAVLVFAGCQRSAVPAQSAAATPTINPADTIAPPSVNATLTAIALENLMNATEPAIMVTAQSPADFPTLAAVTPLPPIETPIPTPPLITTPTPGRPATYTLQSGEFPYCIARRFNVNPDELLALNGLTDGQIFQPGLVLKIPQTGSFPGERARRPHPTTYTVAVNDTIYSIACKFGDVDPIYLASYNNILPPYVLQPGTVLEIP
jgi:LysM repeat protein